ncbi:MAG: 3-dehydroquinate synthase [Bacteroidota bacterium]
MKPLEPIAQSFTVKYEYKLYFTEDLFAMSNPLFKNIIEGYTAEDNIKMVFIIDEEVHKRHQGLSHAITTYCSANKNKIRLTEQLIIPGGETSKNNNVYVEQLLNAINDNGICRHSFVVALGGGALIDMAGYAAAIAHRGVKLIRVPTTVLSQNDAAVGVKNGINIFGKKNFLGTFAPPYAIINDIHFLTTLQQRDWIAGISEAIKVALIKDADFFDFIEQNTIQLRNREMEPMQYLIRRCAQLHMDHIAQGGDPFESGSSRPLDFGHWAAHKLEHMTAYTLRHGEAVAIGMVLDLTYAHLIGLITDTTLKRIVLVLEEIGFALRIPLENRSKIEELLAGVQEFREHLGGKLTITLISEIGTKHDVHEIDLDIMKQAIALQNSFSKLVSNV